MTDRKPDRKFDFRPFLAAAALVGGGGLILLSLFLPSLAISRTNWSPEQAKRYQDASIQLHSLSHAAVHAARDGTASETREKLQLAEAEYKAIRADLDSATARPARIALVLRLSGIALLAVGAFGLYYIRTPSEP